MTRIKPGAPGCEARELPLSYAVPNFKFFKTSAVANEIWQKFRPNPSLKIVKKFPLMSIAASYVGSN